MICSPSWHFRPDLKTSHCFGYLLFFLNILLYYLKYNLSSFCYLNINIWGGVFIKHESDFRRRLQSNIGKNHSVFCCNTEFDVEGIVKLITVISMHHYTLMGLTNGFRIHSKAVYILLRLHYTGRVLLMDWVLISNVIVPSSFCVSSAVRPAHLTHKHTCTLALRSASGVWAQPLLYQAVFSCSFKRLPDERRPHVLQREILIRIIIKRITHCNLLQKHHLLDHS